MGLVTKGSDGAPNNRVDVGLPVPDLRKIGLKQQDGSVVNVLTVRLGPKFGRNVFTPHYSPMCHFKSIPNLYFE